MSDEEAMKIYNSAFNIQNKDQVMQATFDPETKKFTGFVPEPEIPSRKSRFSLGNIREKATNYKNQIKGFAVGKVNNMQEKVKAYQAERAAKEVKQVYTPRVKSAEELEEELSIKKEMKECIIKWLLTEGLIEDENDKEFIKKLEAYVKADDHYVDVDEGWSVNIPCSERNDLTITLEDRTGAFYGSFNNSRVQVNLYSLTKSLEPAGGKKNKSRRRKNKSKATRRRKNKSKATRRRKNKSKATRRR